MKQILTTILAAMLLTAIIFEANAQTTLVLADSEGTVISPVDSSMFIVIPDTTFGGVHHSHVFPNVMAPLSFSGTAPTNTTINATFCDVQNYSFPFCCTPVCAPVNQSTFTNSSFHIEGDVSGVNTGAFSFPTTNQMQFTPSHPFIAGENVYVDFSDQINDATATPDIVRPRNTQFRVGTSPSDGIFTEGQNLYSGIPASMCAKDINGDGFADLVFVQSPSANAKTIQLQYNNGDGTFASPVIVYLGSNASFTPGATAAADVNGDGKPDIISLNNDNASLEVFLNNGSNVFPVADVYIAHLTSGDPGNRATDVRVTDINGDGKPDLVIARRHTDKFATFINDGTGHFGLVNLFTIGFSQWEIECADVDNDGDIDLLTTHDQNGNSFTVAYNDGYGNFVNPTSYPTSAIPHSIRVGDFNGDGYADVAVSCQVTISSSIPNSFNGFVTVYLNNGDGTFAQRADYSSNGLPIGMAVGDVDGDQKLDIVLANYLGGIQYPFSSVSVLKGNGSGGFFGLRSFNSSLGQPIGCILMDADNDGKLDIIARDFFQSVATVSTSYTILRNKVPNVIGTVYFDFDENCQNDSADEADPNVMVKAESAGGTYYVWTSYDGKYYFTLPQGIYQITIPHNSHVQETCNNGQGLSYGLLVQGAIISDSINFYIKGSCCDTIICTTYSPHGCPPNLPPGVICHVPDVERLCPCEEFNYVFEFKNCGSAIHNPTFQIVLDRNVSYCSLSSFTPSNPIPGITAETVSGGHVIHLDTLCDPHCTSNIDNIHGAGQTITWTALTFPAGHSIIIVINAQVNKVPLGTVLRTKMKLIGSCPSVNSLPHTTEVICIDTVKCSGDPNDKTVQPQGCTISPEIAANGFSYRIRFQNLGNAPASTVVVQDYIDNNLDIETLEITYTNNSLTRKEILPGNLLVLTFEGINLPDSASNPVGSIGVIHYSVKPKPNLPVGTQIQNSANIYFDYNLAVITNTTTSTIGGDTSAIAAFTPSLFPPSCNLPAYVIFQYSGMLNPWNSSIHWDFGQDASPPSTDFDPYPFVTYNSFGTKTVTLTVTLPGGCSFTSSQQVEIIPPPPIHPGIYANGSTAICPGGSVQLFSSDPAIEYAWSTGEQTPSIIVSQPGQYYVSITDYNGCTGTSDTITITPSSLSLSIDSVKNVTCVGGHNGNVYISVSGGVPPFSSQTYNLSGSCIPACEAGWLCAPPCVTPTFPPLPDGLGAGTYAIKITDANGCTDSSSFVVTEQTCGIVLNVKAFIQGYYIGNGHMATALLNQFVPGSTDEQVDTVIIELRDPTDFSFVDRYQEIINTSGHITCIFNVATANTMYYIAFRHRNSVFTTSANPVLINNETIYDFTTGPGQAFGNNMTDFYADGYWEIYNGDVNQDEYLGTDDVTYVDIDNTTNSGILVGYDVNDFNGDGYVGTDDVTWTDNNNLIGVHSIHP